MTALAVVLLMTGAALLIAEAHVVSYGVLGFTGVLALAAGGVLLVGAAGGSVLVALALVLPVVAVLTALIVVAGRKSLQVSRRRAHGGSSGLIGRVGVVRREIAHVGDVQVNGELWRARRSWVEDDGALHEGEHVVVEAVHGLTLSVRRAEEWEVQP